MIYMIGHLIQIPGNQFSPESQESVNHLPTDRGIWKSGQQKQVIPSGTREDGP